MIRRLLLAVAVSGAAVAGVVGSAPSAGADGVCAWVDPHGVCVRNPIGGGLPRLPGLPL